MNIFPDVPKTWEELVGLRDYLTDCDALFLRLPSDNDFYAAYVKSIPRKNLVGTVDKEIGDNQTAILVNRFPHTNILQNLPEVKHYCLWSKSGPLDEREIDHLANKKFKNMQWFYMERKVNHKSIPEIWHCHIFVEKNN
jgi:hypothetical protein